MGHTALKVVDETGDGRRGRAGGEEGLVDRDAEAKGEFGEDLDWGGWVGG